MDELLGICAKRSLGSKQEDRKAGNIGSLRSFFSVTPDKKIKIIGSSPDQYKIIEYREFESNHYVIEIPFFPLNQYRMNLHKMELEKVRAISVPLRDYRFNMTGKASSEQIIIIKQTKRSSAVKQLIKKFKCLDKLYE
jgi:hypothetical protein